jgi:hypothetical protein
MYPVMNKQILQEEHLIIMIVDDRCKKKNDQNKRK